MDNASILFVRSCLLAGNGVFASVDCDLFLRPCEAADAYVGHLAKPIAWLGGQCRGRQVECELFELLSRMCCDGFCLGAVDYCFCDLV